MKTLIAEFTVLPGHEGRVAEIMAGLTAKVRQEPGGVACLHALPEEGRPRSGVACLEGL